MMVGRKGLKVKSHFGEGGKDAAAAVDVDVDVGMAAVFWDSRVGLCICSHCAVGYINCKIVPKNKTLTVPPSSPASAAESHKRPIRTDYSSYTRLDSRMRVMCALVCLYILYIIACSDFSSYNRAASYDTACVCVL